MTKIANVFEETDAAEISELSVPPEAAEPLSLSDYAGWGLL